MSERVVIMDTSNIPRPVIARRLWIRGIQYECETMDQMAAREKRYEREDKERKAEMERLWKWKTTPLWDL